MKNRRTIEKSEKNLAVRECSENGLSLKYLLSESTFRIEEKPVYSITVETHADGKEEIVSACDISRDFAEAKKIFDILVKCTVTSCTLYDVLEDIL